MTFKPIAAYKEFDIQSKDDFDESLFFELDIEFKISWDRLRFWLAEDDEVLEEIILFIEDTGELQESVGADINLYILDETLVATINFEDKKGIVINENDVENVSNMF